MHPILVTLPGGLAIHSYGVLLALSIGLPVWLAGRRGVAAGFGASFPLDLLVICFGGSLVGARLEYVRANWAQFAGDPAAILRLRDGGQVFYGGLLLCVLLLLLWGAWKRVPPLAILDVCVPSVALGLAIGRLGCFAAACCHGRVADLPWAVTFTDPLARAPRGVPLHPTQLYEAAGALAIFAVLERLWRRPRWRGQLAVVFFAAYPVLRSLNEALRGDMATRGFFLPDALGPRLSNAQGISLLLLAAALLAWRLLPRDVPGPGAPVPAPAGGPARRAPTPP